jgi:hypothetical protein
LRAWPDFGCRTVAAVQGRGGHLRLITFFGSFAKYGKQLIQLVNPHQANFISVRGISARVISLPR